MFNTAKEYELLNLKPVPFNVELNDCTSLAKWQTEPKDVQGWKSEFNKCNGIGIICGEVSGNLCVIDVDQKHDSSATLSARFLEFLKFMFPDNSFFIEETRSGGLHVYFRLKNPVGPKQVPAKTLEIGKDGKERTAALIEVLGDGQLVFCVPSKGYTIRQGAIEEIPTIDSDTYISIMEMCKTFNEIPEVDSICEEISDADPDDQRVGSIYNRECDPVKFVSWLCVEHGWKVFKKVGDKFWLTRPNKDKGCSATFNHDGKKQLIIFSTSVDYLESQRNGKYIGHSAFKVYATLEFGGNYSEATMELINAGFISKTDWADFERIDREKPAAIDLNEMMPDCFVREYLNEISESMQTAPELAFLPVITMISTTLAGATKVHVQEDWYECPMLFTMGIADPSERKSPIISELQKPFNMWHKDKAKEFERYVKSRLNKVTVLEKLIKKAEKAYSKAVDDDVELGDAENLLVNLQVRFDALSKPIAAPNLIMSDATPEAIVMQMELNGEVVGIISAENEPIDLALGLYSDKPNLAIYLKGYSGDSYFQARKHSEPINIQEAKMSMCVLVQPECTKKLFANEMACERGFVSRFLYFQPESKLGHRKMKPKGINPELRKKWQHFIMDLLNEPHHLFPYINEEDNLILDEIYPPCTELSTEASEKLLVLRKLNEEQLGPNGLLHQSHGFGGKLVGNIVRLALIFQTMIARNEDISGEAMGYAIKWYDVFIDHFFHAMGCPTDTIIDRRVILACRRLSKHEMDGKTLRDVYALLKTKKYSKLDDWREVFSRMTQLDYMKVIEEQTAGRPKKIVSFHPELFKNYVH